MLYTVLERHAANKTKTFSNLFGTVSYQPRESVSFLLLTAQQSYAMTVCPSTTWLQVSHTQYIMYTQSYWFASMFAQVKQCQQRMTGQKL